MRVLVTGGAGFVGSRLVERLAEGGALVDVLDDLSTGSARNLEAVQRYGRVSLVRGDVRDRDLVGDLVREADAVFHLAGIDDRDRLKAAVGMLAHAAFCPIWREAVRPGVIQQ